MLEKFFRRQEKDPKQAAWNEKLKELDRLADRLGMPVDEDIKEAVAALNLMDIPTSSSCGGHIGERFNFPYLMGKAEGRPKYKFPGQREILEDLAQEHSLPVEELEDRLYKYPEIERKFWNYIHEHDIHTTDEYIGWLVETKRLEEKLRLLLEEFNTDKADALLHMMPMGDGYRVESNDEKEYAHPNELDPAVATEKILKAQKEMQAFTEFLKEKYFQKR